MTKKSYKKPNLISHGDVKSLTKANGAMEQTDQAFPNNTPFSDLTFS